MKVCILSMQNVQNAGSLLQSYSLKKIIENLGHEVYFLDIERREDDNKLMNNTSNIFSEEIQDSSFRSRLKRVDKYFLNRLLMKLKIKEQNNIFDQFRQNNFRSNRSKLITKKYDYCVIGSDEVFNCCDNSPWGFSSQLFGDVKDAKHVITYSASCGATTADDVPKKARDKIKQAMLNLEAVSVRDENTKHFVKSISGKDSQINLDPVLINSFDAEISGCNDINNIPEKYCIVYSYYNRIYKQNEIDAIKAFCKKHKLSPIAVGNPQMWINNYIPADPFQILKLFINAEFVITDTFHGTIFSAKYSRKFSVVVRKSNYNKLQDLINRVNILEHQIHNICESELEKCWNVLHNKDEFNIYMAKEAAKSIEYLKNAFDGE